LYPANFKINGRPKHLGERFTRVKTELGVETERAIMIRRLDQPDPGEPPLADRSITAPMNCRPMV
jgi:hypothetical protein